MFTFTSPNPSTFSPSANHCDPINTLKTTNVINLFWLILNATSVIPLPHLITLFGHFLRNDDIMQCANSTSAVRPFNEMEYS